MKTCPHCNKPMAMIAEKGGTHYQCQNGHIERGRPMQLASRLYREEYDRVSREVFVR